MTTEVERREILNSRDLTRVRRLLAEDQALATERMEHWCDHRLGVPSLNYIAMMPRELPGTGEVARALPLPAPAPQHEGAAHTEVERILQPLTDPAPAPAEAL